MLTVALTGGIGSGKSVAAKFFADLGALVVDSDELSREVIDRGTKGFDEVVTTFGDEILSAGAIDRKKLAQIVFSDDAKRRKLENIIHPRVREAFEAIVAKAKAGDIVINQIPLLVETSGGSRFNKIIAITSSIEARRSRLKERGMSDFEIEERMKSQVSESERLKIADYVLSNDGTKDELLNQVEKIFEQLRIDASKN